MDTTVISDAVNLASRVENLTKTYRVPLIVTEDTRLALRDPGAVALRRIDRVLVQGKSQPVVLYEVLDAENPVIRHGKLTNRIAFDAGLACYEALEFEAAIVHFDRVLSVQPSDTVARFLLQRARAVAAGAAAAGVARVEKS